MAVRVDDRHDGLVRHLPQRGQRLLARLRGGRGVVDHDPLVPHHERDVAEIEADRRVDPLADPHELRLGDALLMRGEQRVHVRLGDRELGHGGKCHEHEPRRDDRRMGSECHRWFASDQGLPTKGRDEKPRAASDRSRTQRSGITR